MIPQFGEIPQIKAEKREKQYGGKGVEGRMQPEESACGCCLSALTGLVRLIARTDLPMAYLVGSAIEGKFICKFYGRKGAGPLGP